MDDQLNTTPDPAPSPVPSQAPQAYQAQPVQGQPVPMQPSPLSPEQPKKHTKRNVIVAVACVLVAALVIFVIWWFRGGSSSFFDSTAQEGQASYKTAEEIQAELDRVVAEGMLNISIASIINFENSSAPGLAYIENVPSNKYVLRVAITIDGTGETVYQSGGIRPNNTIESITLSQPLQKGTYPATATFTAYDPSSLEEVGQASARITINVLN